MGKWQTASGLQFVVWVCGGLKWKFLIISENPGCLKNGCPGFWKCFKFVKLPAWRSSHKHQTINFKLLFLPPGWLFSRFLAGILAF